MEDTPFARTGLLIGQKALARLSQARVAVFGLGGVGSFAVEGLARCGVGHFALVDHDAVGVSNLNRQLPALRSTLGRPKVDVMRDRIMDINPEARVDCLRLFYRPEQAAAIDLAAFDCVVDAIDTVRAKVDLAVRAQQCGVPIVSCMGAGNRTDPTQFAVGDLADTSICPLCRAMRKKLRRHGVEHLRVVYSRETPVDVPKVRAEDGHTTAKRPTPGSIAFVPSVAGMVLASEVVRILLDGLPPVRRIGDDDPSP
jgi:tRNA A37 threonylcarbamoyladenosine dehydratase